jgi:indolepyruvate ferredoxin oxidoreductase
MTHETITHEKMTHTVSLKDKYTLRNGHAFMNGTQALVRLPIIQRERDAAAGLNTAGFISGYRGSPLGGYDMELGRQSALLDENHIKFEPGINEDLAATAVWGSQMLDLNKPDAKYDGVFGIWYGKAPGFDRSMDAMKHANAAGTAQHGGVLCLTGDDHGAKSSTLPHQSDHNFMAAFMPVLYPGSLSEFVEYGLLGIAMSRYAGTWVGFKAVGETVETSGTVNLSREGREIILPTDFEMPEGGLNIRWPDVWREQDWRLQRYKGFAAQAFARANKVDRVIWDSPKRKFGIVTTGKSYQDVRQALYELGIDEARAVDIGLSLYKVGMVWPLEPHGIRAFCEGLDEVLVVEEKREMIEHQLRWQLYNWKSDVRPTVVGKHDEKDDWLLPPENELQVGLIAHVIAGRMAKLFKSSDIQQKLDYFTERKRASEGYTPAINRAPYFCSGCPHSASTKVPEGSRAVAGIGCHIMAINMDRNTETFTHMGAEGVSWVGQAPFTREKHMFVNMGDGTYMHSGTLAIRQAVAAKVNATYKILYNDAVAMTGGQTVEGGLTVPQIAAQLKAEGVGRVAVISEHPEDYTLITLPGGVELHGRSALMTLQEEMRETKGVTAIIFDQTCAAEKRRRRKRGTMPDPDHRLFINEAVCEGCGDCSEQSNCISVEPLETPFGRKRRINQSSCNKDITCVQGFCPAFVSVRGGTLKKSRAGAGDLEALNLPELPAPALPGFDSEFEDFNILVTGIGGTGVLTVGGILGMAAHLDGHASSILDMMGLAQKGGAVLSHIRLAKTTDKLRSPRIVTGRCHTLLACDAIVAASKDAADLLRTDRTSAVINSDQAPISDFVRDKNIDFKALAVERQIDAVTRTDMCYKLPAHKMATALMGDAIAANIFMLGYAWQMGLLPLSLPSIEQAINLNGVAVTSNLRSFFWGRMTAHNLAAVTKLLDGISGEISSENSQKTPKNLSQIVSQFASHLKAYQNEALASKFMALVERVKVAEKAVDGGEGLSKTVARNYAKLLSYKDEYEVARLYSTAEFKANLAAQFEGTMKLSLHLAPPFLPKKLVFFSKKSVTPCHTKKHEFGRWVFPALKILSRFKGLRGTAFDIFGYTGERKYDRQLISDYETTVDFLLENLHPHTLSVATEIANIPDAIRGFGHVRERNIATARLIETSLKTRFLAAKKGSNVA